MLFRKLKVGILFIHSNMKMMKGKALRNIACTRKQQPRFYWSCSSVVMNDATPLTLPSAWAELHCLMLTTYMYTPWSLNTRKIWLHNDVVRGDFLQPFKPNMQFSYCSSRTCLNTLNAHSTYQCWLWYTVCALIIFRL